MPGALVAIGLKSPRYSAGALGLRSKVSMWLGPPQSHTTRIDLGLLRRASSARLCRRNRSVKPREHSPPRPMRTNERRLKVPGHRAEEAIRISPLNMANDINVTGSSFRIKEEVSLPGAFVLVSMKPHSCRSRRNTMRVGLISYRAAEHDAVGNHLWEKLAFFLERAAEVRVFIE